MSNSSYPIPAWQEAIRQKCRHPSGRFVRFEDEHVQQSVSRRFEHQVELYPGRTAVVDAGEELTYDTLNRRANQLAHAVLSVPGSSSGQVALIVGHGAGAVIAILGALKAGRCYVPLDASYPPDRARRIIEDSQSSIIVTDHANASKAVDLAGPGVEVVQIPTANASSADHNPEIITEPDSPAYIFYTSGSTGQPKGVVQSHRVVLHMIMYLTNHLRLCPDDRLALLESFGFSGSALPCFGALLSGAGLCTFDVRTVGVTGLIEWLDYQKVTVFFSVPTLFRHLASSLTGSDQLQKLRALWLTGEVLRTDDVELYRKQFSDDCILINGYGATESASMTQNFIDKESKLVGRTVPVGWADDDVEITLLDEAGRQVTAGEVGQIVVRGEYFADGYWRDPELTARAFQDGPDGGSDRIYHTGDLGRLTGDGCLVSLGRNDAQVKVRGYRIEIGDVEAALRDLDPVKEAVVVARDSKAGEKRLVAYLVIGSESRPTASALRRSLAEKLPEYMMPSALVFLDALPLNASGKVDLGALADPGAARSDLEEPYVAPRTDTEKALTELWASLLEVGKVGVNDRFLDLGGNSLQAMRMISRLRETFRVDLDIRALFRAPTIGDVAVVIDQSRTNSDRTAANQDDSADD